MCSCCMSVKDLQHLQMTRDHHTNSAYTVYLSPKTSKVHDSAWPQYIPDHSSVTHSGRVFAARAKFIFYRKIIASLTSLGGWGLVSHMRQPLGRVTETYWNMLKPSRDIQGLWYCNMTCLWHGTQKKIEFTVSRRSSAWHKIHKAQPDSRVFWPMTLAFVPFLVAAIQVDVMYSGWLLHHQPLISVGDIDPRPAFDLIVLEPFASLRALCRVAVGCTSG